MNLRCVESGGGEGVDGIEVADVRRELVEVEADIGGEEADGGDGGKRWR